MRLARAAERRLSPERHFHYRAVAVQSLSYFFTVSLLTDSIIGINQSALIRKERETRPLMEDKGKRGGCVRASSNRASLIK